MHDKHSVASSQPQISRYLFPEKFLLVMRVFQQSPRPAEGLGANGEAPKHPQISLTANVAISARAKPDARARSPRSDAPVTVPTIVPDKARKSAESRKKKIKTRARSGVIGVAAT